MRNLYAVGWVRVFLEKNAPQKDQLTNNTTIRSALNALLNYVLNAGVVGGCGKLCENLPKGLERTACDIACDYVGIKAFVSLLEKADLDPVYFCQELKLCKYDDNGDGSVSGVQVSPASGEASTTFEAVMNVVVTNHTGAGEFNFDVTPGPEGQPVSAGSLYPELAPGAYSVKLSIDTSPGEDPQGMPIDWTPGTYVVSGTFCMGECGSDKPHSKVFGTAKSNFTITA